MRRLQTKTVVVLVTVLAGILGLSASAASAATVAVVDGTVVFTAAPGEVNDVRAGTWAAPPASVTLKVIDAGAPLTAGAGCQQLDANSVWCPEPIFTPLPLVVYAGDGADRVVVDDRERRAVTLYGETGNDTLHAGSSIAGAPVLDGGPGDDDISTAENGDGNPTLRGGTGNDVLTIGELGGGTAQGGDGDDRLVFDGEPFRTPVRLDGGGGNDTYAFGPGQFLPGAMVPGPGFDTLDQSAFTSPFVQPLVFDLSTCTACVERVIGTPFADHITGDQRSQAILGGDGNDVLDGGGGPDVISAQGGDDTINSRDGTIDIVLCGDGADTVTADRIDVVSRTCETVQRGASRR